LPDLDSRCKRATVFETHSDRSGFFDDVVVGQDRAIGGEDNSGAHSASYGVLFDPASRRGFWFGNRNLDLHHRGTDFFRDVDEGISESSQLSGSWR
jgi:hypothetical protein